MSEPFCAQGHCLCKSVTFTANAVEKKIGACHCSMCRAWAGGPFMGVDCGADVTFKGEVSQYDSSDWAERGFCSNCGTHLYYKFKGDGKFIMPAGLFEKQPDLILDHQIFIDEKPDYYAFSNATHNMTGAEVMEMFAPKEE